MARGEAWIQTASGRKFWPLDPRAEDVHFPDIAHHLAQRNRFSGACREPYSVAQHCVFASLTAEEHARILVPNLPDGDRPVLTFALSVLLHDAAEAYGPDISRPVKYSGAVGELVRIEALIDVAIRQAAGLPPYELPDHRPARQEIDRRMLRTEQRDLMPPPADGEDRGDVEPYDWPIIPWRWEIARDTWLDRFVALNRRLDDITRGRTAFSVVPK